MSRGTSSRSLERSRTLDLDGYNVYFSKQAPASMSHQPRPVNQLLPIKGLERNTRYYSRVPRYERASVGREPIHPGKWCDHDGRPWRPGGVWSRNSRRKASGTPPDRQHAGFGDPPPCVSRVTTSTF
jgi:hypothetical protein